MKELFLVMIGGALGTGLRYCCGKLTLQWGLAGFYSTITVNMIGAFLIGYCSVALKHHSVDSLVQATLIVGLFGGLTTFSSLTLEALAFIQSGESARAVIYVLAQVMIGLLLTSLGIFLAGRGITAG